MSKCIDCKHLQISLDENKFISRKEAIEYARKEDPEWASQYETDDALWADGLWEMDLDVECTFTSPPPTFADDLDIEYAMSTHDYDNRHESYMYGEDYNFSNKLTEDNSCAYFAKVRAKA